MNCLKIWKAIKGGVPHTLSDSILEVLEPHKDHNLELVQYGGLYYAIECTDCNEVVLDDETLYVES